MPDASNHWKLSLKFFHILALTQKDCDTKYSLLLLLLLLLLQVCSLGTIMSKLFLQLAFHTKIWKHACQMQFVVAWLYNLQAKVVFYTWEWHLSALIRILYWYKPFLSWYSRLDFKEIGTSYHLGAAVNDFVLWTPTFYFSPTLYPVHWFDMCGMVSFNNFTRA